MTAASQILWSAPRLICVAGDFTRCDVHAVCEHRRSIDLVRYRYFGSGHFGRETVASVRGTLLRPSGYAAEWPGRRRFVTRVMRWPSGDGVTRAQRRQYRAYQWLRNFACLIPPQQTKLLVYLTADPTAVIWRPALPGT
ncbi:hypothetical protein [Streptomyces sp. Root369]|uniref:hypothetical protein n=1 Tax=Streptomyces sp. Root369 TaxID=1736523 RepID=UPI0032213DB6